MSFQSQVVEINSTSETNQTDTATADGKYIQNGVTKIKFTE